MYLFELTDNSKLTHIIAVIDQLKSALDNGQITTNWDVDTLLKYFRKFNIVLSKDDLFSMIKTKPLKHVIQNIEGDIVEFKGIPSEKTEVPDQPPEQSKDIVKKMAKKARKK